MSNIGENKILGNFHLESKSSISQKEDKKENENASLSKISQSIIAEFLKQAESDILSFSENLSIFETGGESEINEVLDDLYQDMSVAETEDERNQIFEKYKSQIENANLTKEETSSSLEKIMTSVTISQNSEISELYEMYNEAQTPEEKQAIGAEINQRNAEATYELNNYAILYNQTLSNLPEEQSEEFAQLYSDLANAQTPEEREEILSQIYSKQEEYNLSDEELSLSNEQTMNSMFASYSLEIADLYETLGDAADNTTRAEILNQINIKQSEYDEILENYYNNEELIDVNVE